MAKLKRNPPTASSAPLFAWFELDKANRAKLRAAGFSDGQITNWKGRGVPRGQLAEIAAIMGISTEQYLAEAGVRPFRAESPRAEYRTLSDEALQIAVAFEQLQPQAREFIREQVFIYTVIDKSFPWLRHGKPIGTTYSEFERWHQDNIAAKRDLDAQAAGVAPRAKRR